MSASSAYGLAEGQKEIIARSIARVLAKETAVKVWIFGSRARGSYRPYSDVDLLLEARPPLSSGQMRAIIEQLDDSDLPFKFDVVRMEDVLPEYSAQIRAEKVLWFELPSKD